MVIYLQRIIVSCLCAVMIFLLPISTPQTARAEDHIPKQSNTPAGAKAKDGKPAFNKVMSEKQKREAQEKTTENSEIKIKSEKKKGTVQEKKEQ